MMDNDTTVNFFSSMCADTKGYNLSNAWSKRKFLGDIGQEGGMLYKLVPSAAAVGAGIYAYKSSRTCTAESELTSLREDFEVHKEKAERRQRALQKDFEAYKEEAERRQRALRKDFDAHVEETERKEFFRNCDNTLCDCISDVYEMVVRHVKKTDPSISNWQHLVRQACNNPEVQSKIETIYRDMGFTDAQWNALRSFKSRRNGNSHCSDDYIEKASVIVAECLGDVPDELREALQHVIRLLQ